MTTTIHATFDGEVLRPDKPIELPANTRVLITVTTDTAARPVPQSFLTVAQGLHLKGPADWSEKLDDYLDGDRLDQHD